MTGALGDATRKARRSTPAQALGRAGMACFGLVHLVVAYLAVTIVFGPGARQADATGALHAVAATPVGVAALWVLACGLVAYGLWQLLLAINGYRWMRTLRDRVLRRLGSGFRGLIVIGLGSAAAIMASGGNVGGSGDQQKRALTARLLALPWGRVVVGAVAFVVLVIGIAALVRACTRGFLDDLDCRTLSRPARNWVARLGVAGYLAKAAVLGIIAVLIGFAAVHANAQRAGGLDAALHTLAVQPYGGVLLTAVAAGFAAFGLYCLAAARYHKN